jgi:N-acetylmuramoyl-L-alanine amidase
MLNNNARNTNIKWVQIKKIAYLCSISFLLATCTPTPYSATNKSYKQQAKIYAKTLATNPLSYAVTDSLMAPQQWVGTTNFNMRKPNFVIIHHTAQNSCEQTLKTFTLPKTQVSSHYVICKDGTVHQMLNDYLRAWHAGNAKWGSNTDINSSSIGIEIDNNGFEPFSNNQMTSLLQLLKNLKAKHNIPTANFIGHADIAPTRKNDPSILFNWKMLADNGFGNWFDDMATLVQPDSSFNYWYGLRIIGYDIKDTTAALRSFKRHFLQDSSKMINNTDKMVINNLLKKYL